MLTDKRWRIILTIIFAALLVLGTAFTSLAEVAFPEFRTDWQAGDAEFECAQAGCNSDNAYKFDSPWGSSPRTSPDGAIKITSAGSYGFTWESVNPVNCVIVKTGGPGGGYAYIFKYLAYYGEPSYGDTITVPSDYAISHVTFCYDDVKYGYLRVEKTWDDKGTGATYTDPIDVVIKNKSGVVVETLKLQAPGWTATSKALLPGDYTFEEITVPGWTPSYTPSNRTLKVEAGATPAAGAIGKIKNTIDTGCLIIQKDWIYPISDDFSAPYFEDLIPEFIMVRVTSADGYNKEFRIPEVGSDKWSIKICGLLPGWYTVEEIEPVEGWVPKYVPSTRMVEVLAKNDADPVKMLIENYAVFKDETIWAYSAYAYDEMKLRGEELKDVVYHNNKITGNPSNAWGWTNMIDPKGIKEATKFEFYLFAGAGQNNTEKGTMVGKLVVTVEPDLKNPGKFCATAEYKVEGALIEEYHLWIGETPLPLVKRGRTTVPTSAPGQFPYTNGEKVCNLDGSFFVSAHGVVRMPYTPDLD